MSNILTYDTEMVISNNRTAYTAYDIVDESNPILKQKIENFDFNSGINVQELVGRLKETLRVSKAYGVAAPQAGLPFRVFVVGANEEYITMFNPEIIEKSKETTNMQEGCLSFPFMVLSVERSNKIFVKFQDENGEEKSLTLEGLSARIVQHELDHLNGITFDTVAKPLALKMGLKKRQKQIKLFAKHLTAQRLIANEKSS